MDMAFPKKLREGKDEGGLDNRAGRIIIYQPYKKAVGVCFEGPEDE